jgi:signal transduction histidine kinase
MEAVSRLDAIQGRSSPDGGANLAGFWRRLSLTGRFTLVAAIVVGITMAVLGRWAGERIEASVIHNTASAAALYMDRFVEPYAQDLASGEMLKPESLAALSLMAQTPAFNHHVIGIKLWRPDGTIVFSNDAALIGKKAPVSDSLSKALRGTVTPEFDHLDDEENLAERGLKTPLLEIYSPIREANTDRVIAVAEFYQRADVLARELFNARVESYAVVGGLSLLMLGALIGIVRQGSRTITTQQAALSAKVRDLSKSLSVNRELRERIGDANRRTTENNERFLRRVSAELHDGPVQLIGLALLRLDGLRPLADAAAKDRSGEALEIIRDALKDALGEIRGLAQGFALPELEELSFVEAVDLAIANHERRSGTEVGASFAHTLPPIPGSLKICAYRFVQEGLNNAFRHANGIGQHVAVNWDGAKLAIEVSDAGPGFCDASHDPENHGLGLPGMRDRIESLGGTMLVAAVPGGGTRLQACFALKDI